MGLDRIGLDEINCSANNTKLMLIKNHMIRIRDMHNDEVTLNLEQNIFAANNETDNLENEESSKSAQTDIQAAENGLEEWTKKRAENPRGV